MTTLKDWMLKQRAAAERKASRASKAKTLWQGKPGMAGNRSGLGTTPRKRRRKPSARKAAFARLITRRNMFVMLRAKRRNGGLCEVKVMCGGLAWGTLVYHILPAATGNAVKHDRRNLLWACARCNGAEYFDRKRGTYERWDLRHKGILGPVHAELKALAGRKQIPTHEALAMSDDYASRIERGDFS